MFRKVLPYLFVLGLLSACSNASAGECEVQEQSHEEVESFIHSYYTLIQEGNFEGASALVYIKDAHRWILDDLPITWEIITVLDIDVIRIDEIGDGLYSAVVALNILIENEEVGFPIYTTEILRPFVLVLDGEYRFIIHARDIPEEFNIPVEIQENEIDIRDIIPL